jgi:hypothetical protein
MTLRVVGAGVGRTGTLSLKAALEQLLDGPCYHMLEVFGHPEHVPLWRDAALSPIEWDQLVGGYVATADFPACLFWRELTAENPDAIVVLSTRRDSAEWWESASQTIFGFDLADLPPEMSEWAEMWKVVSAARFSADVTDERSARAAYDRHNDEVRASVFADRLVEWSPGDGWEPLCSALSVAVPDTPFPHLNSREDFPHVTADTPVSEALEQIRATAASGGSGEDSDE